jgi:ankyrin repeat protein
MTCAAYYGHTDVIRELIENGADVNLVRMDGTSPLWLAANAPDDGGESAALELLSNGAKADIVGSRGGTALHGAAFHGREKLAASLIAAGCPVNAVNSKTSYTALHTAAETKHPKVGLQLCSVGVAGPTCCACTHVLLTQL